MPNCIYNQEEILAVTPETVLHLKEQALRSPLKRFRLCMHHTNQDQTHEMLIVFHHDSFMPPHRHPRGKSESYHIVEGEMAVYFFDDSGNVIKVIEMAGGARGKPFLYRLSGSIWHMPVPKSQWIVYHETYSGPFEKKNDVLFPEWGPDENNPLETDRFLKDCINEGLMLTRGT